MPAGILLTKRNENRAWSQVKREVEQTLHCLELTGYVHHWPWPLQRCRRAEERGNVHRPYEARLSEKKLFWYENDLLFSCKYSRLSLNGHLPKTDTWSWSLPFFTPFIWLSMRRTSLRLFTVLYFSVRSSRSRALRNGLPILHECQNYLGDYNPRRPPPRYIWKSR